MQSMWAIGMQLVALGCFCKSANAATASDLYQAMEVDSSDVSTSAVTGSSTAYDTTSALGVFVPEMGSDMSILHTGIVGSNPQSGTDLGTYGPTGDQTTLTLELTVPSTANSFSLSFAFFSAEYPEYVGSVYNDAFELNIVGTAYTGNAAVDSLGNSITINSALFTVTDPADLSGTSFEGGVGGGTGWLMVVVPVDPSDTIEVEMTVYDVSDGYYDSAVLLDNFEWSESDIDTPTIVEDIDLFYLSPKRGSVDGGETTSVYGENFNSGCTAVFDGVDVDTTYIDSGELEVITEPHDAGLIDVTVECPGVDATLVGGYTFYDEEGSSEPPEITDINPYVLFTSGGETVTLTGTNLDEITQLWIDEGEILDFNATSSTEITFSSPAHAEGWADLTYFDATGWSEDWVGGLLYITEPIDTGDPDSDFADTASDDEEEEEEDYDDPYGKTGECSCSSTNSSNPGWLALGLFALVWTRRRARSMTVIAAFLVGCNEYKLTQYEDVEEEGEDTAVEPLPELELQPPVALAAVGDQIKRMETITLNGSASYDPDGMNEPLIYSWEVSEYPDGANITFADSNTATPSFSADVLGTYVVTLTVTDIDGLVSENLAGTVIEVIAWENLIAILDWDTDELDLDLHMLSPTGSYYGDGDCYYGNPTPDWGEEGVSTDDPSLDSDQESAGEPETITLWQPEEGTYTFYVHYFNPRDAETTWTWPTLEVYAEGDLVAALEGPRLATEGMVWEAGELDWTTLEYTESSSTSTHEAMGGPAVNEKE